MPFKNFDVKYNSDEKIVQNYNGFKKMKGKDSVALQSVESSDLETIYAPDFSKYPRWPYDDFENQAPGQNPNQVIYPQPNQIPNQMPYQNPNQSPNWMNQPSQIPNQNPNQNPNWMNQPNQMPNQNPNQNPNWDNQPSQMPNQNPNQNPNWMNQPNQMPNQNPNQNPNQSPNWGNQPNQMPNQNQPFVPYPNNNFYRNPYVPVGRKRISSGYFSTTLERDMALMKQLYTGINKALYPVVSEVLNEYEYDGSPIYEEELDRESLAQLVDRVIRRAAELSDNSQEAMLDMGDNISAEYGVEWNRSNMMYAIVESLLLAEIFGVRRPNYRKVRARYRYDNGMYDGINYY